jgi:hypothetical protein
MSSDLVVKYDKIHGLNYPSGPQTQEVQANRLYYPYGLQRLWLASRPPKP